MSKRKSKRWTESSMAKAKRKKPSKGNTGPPMCKLCKTRHWNREPHHYEPKKSAIHVEDIHSYRE